MNLKHIRTRERQTNRERQTEAETDRQTGSQTNRQTETERETQRDRKTRLSVTPGHRTVQEGLSMVSCRESITKSKHVLYWKPFTPNVRP